MIEYIDKLKSIIRNTIVTVSTIRPREWAEKNIVMRGGLAGRLRYNETTPYFAEVIDFFDPNNHLTEFALMAASQMGKSKSVIFPAIIYRMNEHPCNMILTVGDKDLIKEAVIDFDYYIESTGSLKLIRSSSMRSNKTGNTDMVKEFIGGNIKVAHASDHKIWRQTSYQVVFADDIEASKGQSESSGSTVSLIRARTQSFKQHKILWCSTPELTVNSIIYERYLDGNQMKWVVPCPCCGVYIELLWETKLDDGRYVGLTWKVDEDNRLIDSSVGYICQECNGFFDESHKGDMLKNGFFKAHAKAKRPTFASAHINCLYAAVGSSNWNYYINNWLEIFKEGDRDEKKYQTFLNTALAIPYDAGSVMPKSDLIADNINNYRVGTVPVKISKQQQNGDIVFLSCAADLNGNTQDDVRLDYEVVAWSETESSYSIIHGSFGSWEARRGSTFDASTTERLSADTRAENSVWTPFLQMLNTAFKTDDGSNIKIECVAIDSGRFTQHVYDFCEFSGFPNCIPVKGKGTGRYTVNLGENKFRKSGNINKLYLLEVGLYKDKLAHLMSLKKPEIDGGIQPHGMMNFPVPHENMYQKETFFSHFEAEERKLSDSKGSKSSYYIWEKKYKGKANHFWDTRIYNMAIKDIYVYEYCLSFKSKNINWSEFLTLRGL